MIKNDKKVLEKLTLVIDDNVADKYNMHYFEEHPRARVKRIKQPIHPSLNQWMIMQRQSMNKTKQTWKDFIVWFIEDIGYTNYGIEQCDVKITSYFKTKARHDNDNYVPKFLLDGLVLSGFIMDDDSKHLENLILRCDSDFNNPRTEICVWVYKKNTENQKKVEE